MNKLDIDCKINNLLSWSFGYFWCPEYTKTFYSPENEGNYLLERAKFLNHFGFDASAVSAEEIDHLCEPERDVLLRYLHEKEVSFHPLLDGIHLIDMNNKEAENFSDRLAFLLEKHQAFFRTKTITCNVNSGSRFDNDMPLEERLEKIINVLRPIVRKSIECGYNFAVENSGNFYCSEIVYMCQSIPGLKMLLDTGNPYLIGEEPISAYYTAAPYTIAVHYRDVKMQPEPHNQLIRVLHCSLGEGNVPLNDCMNILMNNCPEPLTLMFETELDTSGSTTPWESLKKEIDYINSLQE